MTHLFDDVRYSLRSFRANPGFSLIVVAILGLAIGGNTAIFSVVNGVLFKPLPYPHPEQLVRAFGVWPSFDNFPMAPADFVDYRERSQSFSALSVFIRSDLDLAQESRPERVAAMSVTSGFFRVLGFEPTMGRGIEIQDERKGAGNVIVLSQRFWREKFGGDSRILGSKVRLSGKVCTVIGVMPAGVAHPGGDYHSLPHGETVDLWTAFEIDTQRTDRESHYLNAVGRLKPGVTREQANAELNTIAKQLEKEHPDTNRGGQVRLTPLKEDIVGSSRATLLVLLGAVGFVLLIACVNVANLLMARSASRYREMAVRAALGAGTWRIARMALTESMLLSLTGGVVGIMLSFWGRDALVAMTAHQLPRIQAVAIDARVLAVALGLAVLTGVLFGLAPSLQAFRLNLNESLKEGNRSSAGGGRRNRMRAILVVTEISVAFILLVGAGLLIRSFAMIQQQDPGFRPNRVLTAQVDLPFERYKRDDGSAPRFLEALVRGLRSLPGVDAAGLSSDVPWSGYNENSGFEIVGDPDQSRVARFRFASPGYFDALSIPVVNGRDFSENDNSKAPRVVIINAVFVKKFFKGADPVGRTLNIWGEKRTVAGVIADVKDTPASAAAEPTFYFPSGQMPFNDMIVAVRTKSDPEAMIDAVRRQVLALDRELAIANPRTMEQIADDSMSSRRATLTLVALFAAVALVLAAIGIYGVIAYSVTQRIREIGIRMALGAQRKDVLVMVLGEGTRLGGAGIAIGLVGALLVSRALSSLLYGVGDKDPATFTTVTVLAAVMTLAACLIPARRAMRVEPIIALRHE